MNAKVRSGVAYVIAFLTVLSCILCIGGCTDEEVAEALNNQSLAPTVEWGVLENGTLAEKWISGEYTPSQKTRMDNSLKKKYKAEIARAASVKYNCHSYAWYNIHSDNIYWIDDPTLFVNSAQLIATQKKGWKKLPQGVSNWNRVTFSHKNELTHSAIVYVSGKYMLMSKWGSAGVFKHTIKKCPYYRRTKLVLRYYRYQTA